MRHQESTCQHRRVGRCYSTCTSDLQQWLPNFQTSDTLSSASYLILILSYYVEKFIVIEKSQDVVSLSSEWWLAAIIVNLARCLQRGLSWYCCSSWTSEAEMLAYDGYGSHRQVWALSFIVEMDPRERDRKSKSREIIAGTVGMLPNSQYQRITMQQYYRWWFVSSGGGLWSAEQMLVY
jgi:hypothetical protein